MSSWSRVHAIDQIPLPPFVLPRASFRQIVWTCLARLGRRLVAVGTRW